MSFSASSSCGPAASDFSDGDRAPLVSFCIPTFRRARFLGATITSALAQTIHDMEVVVVDDQSPDETAEVVAAIKDPRVRYFRNERNLGVPENLNRALSLARGRYVVLLEDHDLLAATYAESAMALMRKHPRIAFVATGTTMIGEDGQPIARYVAGDLDETMDGRKLLRRLLVRATCPFSVTTLIRREMIERLNPPFEPQYSWYADQHLWMRLCTMGDFGYIAAPLLEMRVREAGHYLDGKEWESHLCVARIHRDDWKLLHPTLSLRHVIDLALYDLAKSWQLVMLRTSRAAKGRAWTAADRENSRRFISRAGRALVFIAGLYPSGLLPALRRFYRWQFQLRHRITPQ